MDPAELKGAYVVYATNSYIVLRKKNGKKYIVKAVYRYCPEWAMHHPDGAFSCRTVRANFLVEEREEG